MSELATEQEYTWLIAELDSIIESADGLCWDGLARLIRTLVERAWEDYKWSIGKMCESWSDQVMWTRAYCGRDTIHTCYVELKGENDA